MASNAFLGMRSIVCPVIALRSKAVPSESVNQLENLTAISVGVTEGVECFLR